MKPKKPIPIQFKLTIALFFIVMAPLAVSAYFIDQLGKTAANVAAGERSARTAVLEKSIDAYHDLVRTTKDLHHEIAVRVGQRPDVVGAAIAAVPAPALSPELSKLVKTVPGLRAISLVLGDGSTIADASRPPAGAAWRDIGVDEPVGEATLRLTFEVSATVNDDIRALKRSIDATKTFVQIKSALPEGYRTAFLVLIGIAGLVAVGLGLWVSRSYTERIASLVSTARRVSEGQVDARAEVRGNDEMAELGGAFNTMLDDLDQTRQQIEYLQRMGVWQDVARRLAHEIKNPLTPIQLAVQQCVSAYKGADTDATKFKKLLVDTGEIVEEEIEGLRRLVDTFRTLGALPKVEASPIPLAEVIEELKLDPMIAARLTLEAPPRAVTVRADKLLLKRVLVNLVENGIHAGQENGNAGDVVVAWSTDARGDVARITIDDHGKGVSEDNREKIFEPYVTTKQTGTGLGLAIARKIAIEHGGELSVAPGRPPTGGARFVIALPLRLPESSLG